MRRLPRRRPAISRVRITVGRFLGEKRGTRERGRARTALSI